MHDLQVHYVLPQRKHSRKHKKEKGKRKRDKDDKRKKKKKKRSKKEGSKNKNKDKGLTNGDNFGKYGIIREVGGRMFHKAAS